jgi:hypothetical protein
MLIIRHRLENLVLAAIGNRQWHVDNNGVIVLSTATRDGDRDLARGMSTVYQRNVTSPAIKEYLRSYLGVQVRLLAPSSTGLLVSPHFHSTTPSLNWLPTS